MRVPTKEKQSAFQEGMATLGHRGEQSNLLTSSMSGTFLPYARNNLEEDRARARAFLL